MCPITANHNRGAGRSSCLACLVARDSAAGDESRRRWGYRYTTVGNQGAEGRWLNQRASEIPSRPSLHTPNPSPQGPPQSKAQSNQIPDSADSPTRRRAQTPQQQQDSRFQRQRREETRRDETRQQDARRKTHNTSSRSPGLCCPWSPFCAFSPRHPSSLHRHRHLYLSGVLFYHPCLNWRQL